MGFINISGNTVHTSALSGSIGITGSATVTSIFGTNSTTTTLNSGSPYLVYGGSTANYSIHTTYHVLGEDIEVDAYSDANVAIVISTLNVLGKPFYDELKKNNVSLPKEIEDYLEIKFKILERDRKINDVLK
jgi:hypothetical protein